MSTTVKVETVERCIDCRFSKGESGVWVEYCTYYSRWIRSMHDSKAEFCNLIQIDYKEEIFDE
jgi:hypothetical protein